MSEFVLGRNHVHRSTMGHIVNFVKGVPTFVPPLLEREVASFGAEPVDGVKIDLLEPEPVTEEQMSASDRESDLLAAFELLEKRNQRGDFTGQNRPAPKALREICGFDVETRERDDAWQKYIEQKAEKLAQAGS